MEEWKEYKLGEVVRIINGRAYSQYELLEAGKYKIVRVGNLSGGDRWFYSNMELLKEKYCEKGDLLYAWACNFGPYIWKDDKTIFHYHIWKLIEDKNVVDKLFLYYYLMYLTPYWLGNVNGSVMVHITKGTMEKFLITLPCLITQRRIASILKSLDDKIEVNKQINDNFYYQKFLEIIMIWMITSIINDNLEQQAQAIFKSWFVDFEPFKDGEFVDSELGRIPKGWKVGTYDEMIQEAISGDWGKEKSEGNYTHKVACIRGCDFQDIKNGLRGNTPERFILEKNYQKKHFKDKDILVEISGGTATVSTGRVCPVSQQLIDKFENDIVCTNFCRLIRPKSEYGTYLYYSWLYKYNNKVMFSYENGTSGIKNFRIKDFTALEPVVIPPVEEIFKFQIITDKILQQMQSSGIESQNLASLRDTLLPKLMSGELKVSEINM